MVGSSKPQPSTTTTTQTSEPPAYLRPFLEQAATESRRLYENPTEQFYPGQTYVSPSTQTLDSLNLLEQRARAGSPANAAAENQITATLRGDYLDPSFYKAQFAPVVEEFNRNVLPGIQGQFAKSGRYGSGASALAVGDAGSRLAGQLGSIASQNMQNERQRQMAAAGMAPSISNAAYSDIGQLAAVGESREGIDALKLQEDMARFGFEQNKDSERLNQYISQLSNNPYSRFGTNTGTSTAQPSYIKPNRFSQGLGLAMTAGGIAMGNPFMAMGGMGQMSAGSGGLYASPQGMPSGATAINTSGGLPWLM